MGQAFDHDEEHRDEEDPEQGGDEHAGDDSGPELLARDRPCACSTPQRHAAEYECKGRHEDRPQAQARSVQRSLHQRLALLELEFRELDDQDGVLRRQTDQHDKADLSEDVQLEVPHHEAQEGAKYGERRAEQDAERQRPALVLGRQDEEDHDQGQDEYGRGAGRRLLLIGHCIPGITHFRGQRISRHFLERSERIARAVAGRG